MGTATANNTYGRISNSISDKNGFCYGTIVGSTLVTSYHCILDNNGYFSSSLVFHQNSKQPEKISIPPSTELRSIDNLNKISRDFVFLGIKIENSFSKKISCDGYNGLMYLPLDLDESLDSCYSNEWESGIFTLSNCALKKGYSGLPLYSDENRENLCAIYSMTVENKNNKQSFGVAVKLKEE